MVISAAAQAGCVETNYRTEVIPNGEGGVQIERVPKPPEAPKPPAPPVAEAPPPPPPPVDPDLAEVQKLWPSLSPADRKTVLDLTHRLAAPQ